MKRKCSKCRLLRNSDVAFCRLLRNRYVTYSVMQRSAIMKRTEELQWEDNDCRGNIRKRCNYVKLEQ